MENKNPHMAAALRIRGRVQGVGYRYFAQETATAAGLVGWVSNLPDGDVSCEVEGPHPVIERWIEVLKKGPPLARVKSVTADWKPASNRFSGFRIR